jgi:hypothetical protein
MKLAKLSLTILGAGVLLCSSAFAGETNKITVDVADKVNVDGKPLNPGKYTVEWTGTGANVQVTIRQGKQTVATVSAHLTEQANNNAATAYGSSTEADGSKSLTAIYVGGKKSVLELNQKSASQQSTSTEAK